MASQSSKQPTNGEQGSSAGPSSSRGSQPPSYAQVASTSNQADRPNPAAHARNNSNSGQQDGGSGASKPKKKKKRGGKHHKRDRRSSFAAASEIAERDNERGESSDRTNVRPSLADLPEMTSQDARDSFYRLGRGASGSATSLESEALLDHREHGPLQARRQSIVQGIMPGRLGMPTQRTPNTRSAWYGTGSQTGSRLRRVHRASESEDNEEANDRTPLMGASFKSKSLGGGSYGAYQSSPREERSSPFGRRRQSGASSRSSRKLKYQRSRSADKLDEYDINNPPSVPGSPKYGVEGGFDDVMMNGAELERGRSPERNGSRELLIDIEENTPIDRAAGQVEHTAFDLRRRMTMAAEDDVCFPHEDVTELGDEDANSTMYQRRRRRRREWPDLGVLEDWAGVEKEQRTMDQIRARQVNEPVLIDGRLRPSKLPWHREQDDQQLRFTYFNEEFEATMHSESFSELLHGDLTFRNLFIPERPLLSDSDSESDEEDDRSPFQSHDQKDDTFRKVSTLSPSRPTGRASSVTGSERPNSRVAGERRSTLQNSSNDTTGQTTPVQEPQSKQTRYGSRPIWWLDVLCPTEAEMKILQRAFGIHPLTAEDVMMQEQREKVELFRNYYFVSYKSFEQDPNHEDHMEPVTMYVIVFREGVISFHFSQTPHPANVRRRIRQLKDYMILTTDWIGYAIIDDITDSYAPLIERIEEEVDDIDEAILTLHAASEAGEKLSKKDKAKKFLAQGIKSEKGDDSGDETLEAGDMLRNVGECRKKVMSLYRLLGNKADVIKGFAKRCNEQWDIAPRSDIGLYLGDIQDHIVTMTANLSHYENLLSRAHSNYLAQINIRMNERAEKTNDVLGKLTVLGTIVLPMNIVTGLWGMNCIVPGQDIENLNWFWGITGGLFVFGFSCYFIAKRVFGIV